MFSQLRFLFPIGVGIGIGIGIGIEKPKQKKEVSRKDAKVLTFFRSS